jgi:DNA-binding CsgD family transcriptional regulator
MDVQASEKAGDTARLERIAGAFQDGIVLVDAEGTVVWLDRTARRRVNGELRSLILPLAKADRETVDCFITPVELAVGGQRLRLGVIQAEEPRPDADLMAKIESVLADSTSWFTRTIVEKLKALGQPKPESSAAPGETQLNSLSAREREVLGLICEGHNDVQMADLLGLSENTVRNHVSALYRKIGVKRRMAAVIWARELGITCRDDLKLLGGVSRLGSPRSGHGRHGNGHDRGSRSPY